MIRRAILPAAVVMGLAVIAGAVDPLPDGQRVLACITGGLVIRAEPAPPDQAAQPPLRMPTDVAVDSTGRVFVADGVNNRVVVFDASGRAAPPITVAEGVNLSRPTGLAVDARDRLWIADTANRRVVVVADAGRELIEIIPLPQANSEIPVDATDLAVSPDLAWLYVADNDNHRLLVRDNRTRQWSTVGRRGPALGQMLWPFMLACDPDGRVYVTEAIGARVQRFVPAGGAGGAAGPAEFGALRAERAVAVWGLQAGQVYRPKGIAADRAGRVFVSDSTTGAVQVFAPTGRLIGALSGPDGRPIRFDHPMGLAVGPGSVLYVVELKADRVAAVSLAESTLAPVQPPATQPE